VQTKDGERAAPFARRGGIIISLDLSNRSYNRPVHKEVCTALWEMLMPLYLKEKSSQEWKNIAQ
jgi:hypothetical protein